MDSQATAAAADVHIVLVRPRRAINLGGVARAMKNFAQARLSLVAPQIKSWADAWRMAVKADDVLRGVRQCATLDEAIPDATWVVGTTNRARPGQRLLTPRELAQEARQRGGLALLFGDEESGLSNEELLRCHDVVTIPAASEQSSLNLAQAALVCVYELFVAASDATAAPPPAACAAELADDALLRLFEHKLGAALQASAWADADREPLAVQELVQAVRRGRPTRSEALAWLTALGKIVQPRRRP